MSLTALSHWNKEIGLSICIGDFITSNQQLLNSYIEMRVSNIRYKI